MALSWLDNEVLALVLKASYRDDNNKPADVRVMDFRVSRTTEDKCCGTMHKVHVWFKDPCREEIRERTFVFKLPIPMTWKNFIEKETLTYTIALPKIEEYLHIQFAPKLLLIRNEAMIMENIRECGFTNVDAMNLLDYNHCVVALETLAQFHAGSVLLHQKDPNLVEYKIGWEICIDNPNVDVIKFFYDTFYTFEKEISTWPEAKHYVKDFKCVRKNIEYYFKNIENRKCFKVLNHGDFWLNNLRFRYDSSRKVQNAVMVDFQGCRYSSPACDIQYFIASSTNLDVRMNRLDNLLDVYLNKLNECFVRLKLPQRLTKLEFEESLKQEYMMYFIGLVISLCTCLNDPKDWFTCESYEDLGKEANLRFESLLRSRRYKNFIIPVLHDISKKGAFLSFR